MLGSLIPRLCPAPARMYPFFICVFMCHSIGFLFWVCISCLCCRNWQLLEHWGGFLHMYKPHTQTHTGWALSLLWWEYTRSRVHFVKVPFVTWPFPSSCWRRPGLSIVLHYCGWRMSLWSYRTQTTVTSSQSSERCVCVGGGSQAFSCRTSWVWVWC